MIKVLECRLRGLLFDPPLCWSLGKVLYMIFLAPLMCTIVISSARELIQCLRLNGDASPSTEGHRNQRYLLAVTVMALYGLEMNFTYSCPQDSHENQKSIA